MTSATPSSGRANKPTPKSSPLSASVAPPVTARSYVVWLASTLIYVMAIVGRTSMGVAGVQAMEHFHIDASRLAVFISVQVGVYALSQIPMGVAIDRFRPRAMLLTGAIIMACGQLILGVSDSFSSAIIGRVFVGVGDASAFLSVMRLIPAWFPLQRAPLMSQLLASLGWTGQFLSAVPFLMVLQHFGWQGAFLSLGIAGIVIAAVAAVFIRNSPHSKPPQTTAPVTQNSPPAAAAPGLWARVRYVAHSPVCWEGFFTHWVGLMPNLTFTLLWGVPLLTLGVGLSPSQASSVLVVGVCITIVVSPLHGIFSARLGRRRALATVVCNGLYLGGLGIFFASNEPRGLVFCLVVAGLGFAVVPSSNFGFDTIREDLDHHFLATGTGLANMGGFIAVMITGQAMGFVLDTVAPDGVYTWQAFRVAWLAVFATWAVGVCAVAMLSRRAASARARSTSRWQVSSPR